MPMKTEVTKELIESILRSLKGSEGKSQEEIAKEIGFKESRDELASIMIALMFEGYVEVCEQGYRRRRA